MTTAERTRNTQTASANIVRISADRYLVPSRTEIGKTYLVIRNAEGRMICDCDAAIVGRACWHLTAVAKVAVARGQSSEVDPAVAARRAAGMSLITGGRL
jgi:hypothetical protein